MDDQTPMMRQYHEVKLQHPDLLVFFRLGDFYEMFYEDAVLASRELEITLTSRNSDRNGQPIPMCGIPHHGLNTYLARLIRKGHKVAICDQVEDPRQAKGIIRREVTRIVTPGTVIEDGLLDAKENNYLAALVETGDRVGASFLDLSTGEFCLTECSGEDRWELVRQELFYYRPSELVLPESQRGEIRGCLGGEPAGVDSAQADWTFDPEYGRRSLLGHFKVATLDGFGLKGHEAAVAAAGGLLAYVRETQRCQLAHIRRLRFSEAGAFLKLDESTVQNLELVRGADGNKRWSLLGTLDSTKTGMGGRLLRSWMLRPCLDVKEISERLDAVEALKFSVVAMEELGRALSSIHDLERLLSRVTLETAGARDLLALKESFLLLPELNRMLDKYKAPLLAPLADCLEDVADLLDRSLNEEAPVHLNDGGTIREGYHPELDELRAVAASGKGFIARLESAERSRTGISNLKVRYNRVFGYFIEVTKSNLDSVPEHYVRKQTLVNCERFITPELKEYEEKVLGAEERILELEKELFAALRRSVGEEAERIQKAARFVSRLDVLLALAEGASRYRYVRPQLDLSDELEIRGGRHPVVERQSTTPFTPNDLYCNTRCDQLILLTGPNMGGKSTYLRQNALIVILAQMGSFVPAESCRIGLVDRIFTRVGASDNLARGRSTFMVEMIETANILNTASPRSLILLDEVGRGTATFDGLSIAWAVAEYLLVESSRKARTLFATHYQELTKLADLYEGAQNFCVTVRESGQDIIFFHRVLPGIANKSYGIEVARLAGMPSQVLGRAREILGRLERKQISLHGRSNTLASDQVTGELQRALF